MVSYYWACRRMPFWLQRLYFGHNRFKIFQLILWINLKIYSAILSRNSAVSLQKRIRRQALIMFDGIVGHERACSYLTKLCGEQSFRHAYLLVGPHHVGKATIARCFAAALLAHEGVLTAHPDYCEIDVLEGDTTIAIESVRALVTFIAQKPFVAKRKVAYVHHAEALQPLAADALLKTLEEPTGDRVMILTTIHPDYMAPTIRSRCQQVRFELVDEETLAAWLAIRFSKVSAELRADALARAAGRPGVAVRLLEDPEAGAALAQREEALQTVLRAGAGERLRWVARTFGSVRDAETKRTLAREVLEGYERAMHAACLEGRLSANGNALAILRETRHALDHNVSPQMIIEQLVLFTH